MTGSKMVPYILTPQSRICEPVGVRYQEGNVKLDSHNAHSFSMSYGPGEERPCIILDMGPASPGGYPVFQVEDHKGTPVLRLAYSDWFPYLMDSEHRYTGDFLRGCCKYLGVELPVLPGNPNRYELYTIRKDGHYTYPLIQGQQRFVLLTLDTYGKVTISGFHIHYTGNMDDYDGKFICSNTALNQLWYSSTYTVQLAEIDSAKTWECVEGHLMLRALTKGNPAGIVTAGKEWKDYVFTFSGSISVNPDYYSGIGWLVRAQDCDTGYAFQLSLDGVLRWYIRKNGVNLLQKEVPLSLKVFDNMDYVVETKVSGNTIKISIDGDTVFSAQDETFAKGSVGFIQTTEKWAYVNWVTVKNGNTVLFQDTFTDSSEQAYEFTKSPPFLADGAKRDRLPWIGDLDWAGRNTYYAFTDDRYMWESLKMFARHQTPDGYIWGVCYPENTDPVRLGEYGYYESDIFSAWFVPTLWDYLLFTGKKANAKMLMKNVVNDLEYLWSFVDEKGLFFQRYATSKGLWDHELKDIGYFSYNNLIVYDSLRKGSLLAEELGDRGTAEQLYQRSVHLKKGIMDMLWDEKRGYFTKGLKSEQFCYMANCLALATAILTKEQAVKVKESLEGWFPSHLAYGKIVSLYIRGCFQYGFEEEAYAALTGKTGLSTEGGTVAHVDWLGSIFDDNGPATTTECMLYPPVAKTDGEQWFDRSHPDTAVAHLLTGFILGVQPTSPGFRTFSVEPHCCGMSSAIGTVPTPYGPIKVEWEQCGDGFSMKVNHPKAVQPSVSLEYIHSPKTEVIVNGNVLGGYML